MGDIALDEEDLQTLFPTEYERLMRSSAQNRAAHFANPAAAHANAQQPRRLGAPSEDAAPRGTRAASGAAAGVGAPTGRTSEEDVKARREREEEEEKAQEEKEKAKRERAQAATAFPAVASAPPVRPRGALVRRPGRRYE